MIPLCEILESLPSMGVGPVGYVVCVINGQMSKYQLVIHTTGGMMCSCVAKTLVSKPILAIKKNELIKKTQDAPDHPDFIIFLALPVGFGKSLYLCTSVDCPYQPCWLYQGLSYAIQMPR